MINPQIMLFMVTNRIIHYECLLGEHWLLKYLNASLVNLSRLFFMNQTKKEAAMLQT